MNWSPHDFTFDNEPMPQQLRLLAVFHTNLAKQANMEAGGGWTEEAAFHYMAADTLMRTANQYQTFLDGIEGTRKARNAK